MRVKRNTFLFFMLAALLISVLSACASQGGNSASSSTTAISIVATENFYGDIFKQLGGNHVKVTSIISDPDVDPHQYESSVQNAVAVGNAKIVIKNGGGYDSWMDRLLAASPSSTRTVLVATDVVSTKLPDNPHLWYDIHDMQMLAQAMDVALKKVDSKDAVDFDRNLRALMQSLQQVIQKMDEIHGKYAGTPVGLTEDIYLYQAMPLGLHVLTPFEFQKAIAEGNDPPADTVVTANNQVNQHRIKVLIYNKQTVTPITTNLRNAAQKQHIPIVGVTETMPQGKTYQQWMLDQLNQLEQALQ